jgi:hypothetical protein
LSIDLVARMQRSQGPDLGIGLIDSVDCASLHTDRARDPLRIIRNPLDQYCRRVVLDEGLIPVRFWNDHDARETNQLLIIAT